MDKNKRIELASPSHARQPFHVSVIVWLLRSDLPPEMPQQCDILEVGFFWYIGISALM